MSHQSLILTAVSLPFLSAYWLLALTLTLHGLAMATRREWQAIEAALEERAQLIERLCVEARTLFVHDPIIARYAADYENLTRGTTSPVQALRDTIDRGSAARGIVAQIQTYPALFQSPTILRMARELDAIDDHIFARARNYDQHAASFNSRRHDFMASVIACIWTKTDIPSIGTLTVSRPRLRFALGA